MDALVNRSESFFILVVVNDRSWIVQVELLHASHICIVVDSGLPASPAARAQRDPEFRQALLREAVECVINGDLGTGKAVLRDYVNATVGFQKLEKRTRIPAKSLMRMPGPKGSPSAANLSSILTVLQKTEGVRFELALRR